MPSSQKEAAPKKICGAACKRAAVMEVVDILSTTSRPEKIETMKQLEELVAG